MRPLPSIRSLVLFLMIVSGFSNNAEAARFRVLVAFTDQAVAYGFYPATIAGAINGIAAEVYANSSPNYTGYQMPEIELAGTVKVSYTGNSMKSAVNALKSKTDGIMDEIHALRDDYKADFVILVHPFSAGGGRAYKVDAHNEAHAFAVVSSESAWSTLHAHEIGHLVGCLHDFQDPLYVPTSLKHAYGYVDPSNAWGDVMTYHNHIAKWFSNPYESHNGAPRGIVDSADCTRRHHEKRDLMAGFRTTPSSVTMANIHLEEKESIFWNVPGPIYFVGSGGPSSTLTGSLVSLRSDQNVYFLGFPHAQIVTQNASTFLKSAQTIEFSGEHGLWSSAIAISDSLKFPIFTKTIFKSAIANLNANVIYHESGAPVSIETDPTDSFGSYIMMNVRNQIRLSDGFKIRSRNAFLRISGDLDPFEDSWENILDKPAVNSGSTSASIPGAFQSKVVQNQAGVSLEYSLPERGPLSAQVFDLKGRLAGSVNVRHPRPGTQTVVIPGRFENGTVYFVKVMANGKTQTHRFVKGL